ncbi:Ig-like domain-containing protein, partial [Cocleimonas flava]|uniref:Ig-like domain-containing protein n=1 Tax=Cocleimonas flava TaxID=634765 RepID=UPI001A9E4023
PDGSFGPVTSTATQPSGDVSTTQTDPANNISPAVTDTYTDTTAPAAPTQVITVNTDGTLSISGTGDPGNTATVTFPDNTTGTATIQPDGSFGPVTSTATQPSGDVSTTQTDPANNISPAVTDTYTDTTAPDAPTQTIELNPDGTLTITGSGEPGATATVTYPDGTTDTAIVQPDGTFGPVTSTNPQTSGEVTTTQTDPSGNTSLPTTDLFTDLSAPDAPTQVITVNPDGTISITGTGEPGNTATVTFPDNTTGTATIQPDGTFGPVTSVATQPSGTVSTNQTDDEGKISPPVTDYYTDNLSPSAPTINVVDGADGYLSASEISAGITAVITTPAGTVAGDVLTVDTDGDSLADHTIVLTTEQSSGGTVNVIVDPLDIPANGTFTIEAQITDESGNTGDSASVALNTDSVAPSLTITAPSNSSDATPGLTGSSDEIGAVVSITVRDSSGVIQTISATVLPNGSYSVEVPSSMANGDYTVNATVADAYGNSTSISASGSIDAESAPVANNDKMDDQPLGQTVTIHTVGNDIDADNNLDPKTVTLRDTSGNSVTSLLVSGEGNWTVDATTGDITFTPITGYLLDPTPISYTVKDTTGLESNVATVTIDYEDPAALEGAVWLDSDQDNTIDASETLKSGWTLKIKNDDSEVVASTTTNSQGGYSVTGLIPQEYSIELFNTNGTLIGVKSTQGSLTSGQVLNLLLSVDPSGIMYDSATSEELADVTIQLVNSQGTAVSDSCLGEGQQNQVTTEDGIYAFDVNPAAHSSCQNNETYTIKVLSAPAGYFTNSTIIPPQAGVYDSDSNESRCTVDVINNSGRCEVQGQPDAPKGDQDKTYYMNFSMSSGDSNVIYNHIALDSEIARQADIADDTILMSISASKKQVSVGDQLYYTIRAENTEEDGIDVDVRNDLPKGFKFVSNEAKLTRAGEDKSIGTDDDIVTTIKATGTDAISFGPLALDGKEVVQIGYIAKIGTTANQGNAVNTGQAFATDSDSDVASNIATATVAVVADSVLDQSTLIGKVFHDRDGDGYQDPASVTGLTVKSDYFGWNSLNLGRLNGRISANDDPGKYRRVVRMPYSKKNDFKVTTQQGTVITVDNQGRVKTAHRGEKRRGLTAQDIRVTTRRIRGVPTQTPIKSKRVPAKDTDVLEITMTNYGINEEGIPGVRLATAEGLLIETDSYGRYHIPDVDGGRRGWGKNFIIKVDVTTLPKGSRFTTENPRVLRVTSSALSKINFGIQLPNQQSSNTQSTEKSAPKVGGVIESEMTVEVILKSDFFVSNQVNILAGNLKVLDEIAAAVKEHGSAIIQIKSGKNKALTRLRANVVRKALHKKLGNLMGQVKVEAH